MEDFIRLIKTTFGITLDIGESTPLLSSGLIDSLRFEEFLLLLKEKYGVDLDLQDVGADNFDTPAQMFQLIRAK